VGFESIYYQWLSTHINKRKGERKRRLVKGHGHAERLFLEKVWYSAFGHFDFLHPEYETSSFRDSSRFIDFAFIQSPIRLAIEIDGYGPHSAKQSRWQFSDSLMRQNHLTIDGWRILRFSFDDINEKPRMCEQILQQFMGISLGLVSRQNGRRELLETEVVRLALRLNRNLRPKDVCELLQIHKDTAQSILHNLHQKQALIPAGKGTRRINCYKINPAWINNSINN
jgi:very-short-patch-repair endonuclease